MTTNDALALLLRSTFSISLAILILLAIRLPMRRLFGCGVAYVAWLAVPLCAVAVLIPHSASLALPLTVAIAAQPLAQAVRVLEAPAAAAWPVAVLALWLGGVLSLAILQAVRQRRFVGSLGRLHRIGDVAHATSSSAGPALVGLLDPLIVLPSDFEQRYSAVERGLILAHERAHARRGDALANLGIAVVQCIWWFNPLVHIAAHLARLEQELACDADVVRSHPQSVRDYASAMLKTQLAASSAPLACQWRPTHPVKERIMNLNRHKTRTVRMTGSAILALALSAASYAAWAMQAAPLAPIASYDMALEMEMGDDNAKVRLRTASGEQAAVELGDGARRLRATFVVNPAKNNSVYVTTTLTRAGKLVGEPAFLAKVGEQAGLRYALANNENVAMRMTVTPALK